MPVAVATASRTDMPVRLSALGSVAAFNTVTVRPRVDGQLMRVLFREGQFVKARGSARRDRSTPVPGAAGAGSGPAGARSGATRQRAGRPHALSDRFSARTRSHGRTSMHRCRRSGNSRRALKVDQAAIDSARLNLTYSRITAPIGGRVGLRLVDAGNVVTASGTTGLVVITQVEPIAVVFTLPEDALRTVLPRIRADATLPVDAFDRSGADAAGQRGRDSRSTIRSTRPPALCASRPCSRTAITRSSPRSSSTFSCSPTHDARSSSSRSPPCSRGRRAHSSISFATGKRWCGPSPSGIVEAERASIVAGHWMPAISVDHRVASIGSARPAPVEVRR